MSDANRQPSPDMSAMGPNEFDAASVQGNALVAEPRMIWGCRLSFVAGVYAGWLLLMIIAALVGPMTIATAVLVASVLATCAFLCFKSDEFLDLRWFVAALISMVLADILARLSGRSRVAWFGDAILYLGISYMFGWIGNIVWRAMDNSR